MASTNQINKVVELIVVFGRFTHPELLFIPASFLLEKSIQFFAFFLYCFFDDDLAKSLLFGLFGISWKGLE